MTLPKTRARKWRRAAFTFTLFVAIGLSGRQLIQSEPWHSLWPVAAGVLALAVGLGASYLEEGRRRPK